MENETRSAKSGDAFGPKTAIFLLCVVAVGIALAVSGKAPTQCGCIPPKTEGDPQAVPSATLEKAVGAARPRLVDLGASACIPCKMMAPVLDELKEEYTGRFDVEFIDVWKNRDAAHRYGIRAIPTQIFFDAEGNELYRHQGFFAKQEILDKWQELGTALTD